MRYCLHERKSEKTGCTDERLAAQTKARTDPVRSDNRWQRQAELDLILAKNASKRLSDLTGSVWAFWVLAAGEEGVTTVYRWYPARRFVVDMIKSETCE